MNLSISEFELPLRLRFERPLSDEELLRFCTENELLRVERDANGEIVVMSPHWSESGGQELQVGGRLLWWANEDGRGRAYGANAGFTLPDGSMRAADAAWVSWNRWNALTDEQRHGYAHVRPEFVMEVRSKSDRLPPLVEKMQQWIANGAELAWLIDPIERVVTVYRPGAEPEVHTGPTSVQGTGPVRGFELAMAQIWN